MLHFYYYALLPISIFKWNQCSESVLSCLFPFLRYPDLFRGLPDFTIKEFILGGLVCTILPEFFLSWSINSGKQRLYYYRFNDFMKEDNIYQYLGKSSLREVGSRVASPWDRQRTPANSCKSYIFILCVLLFLGHLP